MSLRDRATNLQGNEVARLVQPRARKPQSSPKERQWVKWTLKTPSKSSQIPPQSGQLHKAAVIKTAGSQTTRTMTQQLSTCLQRPSRTSRRR
jgi:hypothetical protein